MAARDERPVRSLFASAIKGLRPAPGLVRGGSALERLPADLLVEVAQLVVSDWRRESAANGCSLALVSSTLRTPAQLGLLRQIHLRARPWTFGGLRRALLVEPGRPFAVRHFCCHQGVPDAANARLPASPTLDASWAILGEALAMMTNLSTLSLQCRSMALGHMLEALGDRGRSAPFVGWTKLKHLAVRCEAEEGGRFVCAGVVRLINYAAATLESLRVMIRTSDGQPFEDGAQIIPLIAPLPKMLTWDWSQCGRRITQRLKDAGPRWTRWVSDHDESPRSLDEAQAARILVCTVYGGVDGAELSHFTALRELHLLGEVVNLRALPPTITHLIIKVHDPSRFSDVARDPSWLPHLRMLHLYAPDPTLSIPHPSTRADGEATELGVSGYKDDDTRAYASADRVR